MLSLTFLFFNISTLWNDDTCWHVGAYERDVVYGCSCMSKSGYVGLGVWTVGTCFELRRFAMNGFQVFRLADWLKKNGSGGLRYFRLVFYSLRGTYVLFYRS